MALSGPQRQVGGGRTPRRHPPVTAPGPASRIPKPCPRAREFTPITRTTLGRRDCVRRPRRDVVVGIHGWTSSWSSSASDQRRHGGGVLTSPAPGLGDHGGLRPRRATLWLEGMAHRPCHQGRGDLETFFHLRCRWPPAASACSSTLVFSPSRVDWIYPGDRTSSHAVRRPHRRSVFRRCADLRDSVAVLLSSERARARRIRPGP